MGYFSELAMESDRLIKKQENTLPGATERGAEHNARIVFTLHDGSGQERYFATQAEALRAKRRLMPMSYRSAIVQYWHNRELIWIG